MSAAISCEVSSPTARKHGRGHTFNMPKPRVVLGANPLEDRVVSVDWYSDGARCAVSLPVFALRKMLAEAEAYKPGATLSKPEGGAA